MIVDDDGNVFEDRRKNKDGRRRAPIDTKDGKKIEERRRDPAEEKNKERK